MQGDHKRPQGCGQLYGFHIAYHLREFVKNLRGSISGGRHELTKIVSYERPLNWSRYAFGRHSQHTAVALQGLHFFSRFASKCR